MTEAEQKQREEIAKELRNAPNKKVMEQWVVMYLFEPRYSREAIAYAMKDIEIERGW